MTGRTLHLGSHATAEDAARAYDAAARAAQPRDLRVNFPIPGAWVGGGAAVGPSHACVWDLWRARLGDLVASRAVSRAPPTDPPAGTGEYRALLSNTTRR